MKQLCDAYVRHARLIGALYCAVPVAIWYAVMFATIPFRSVYLARLVLSLAVGCFVSAMLNDYGVKLWLTKHNSMEGPATARDGFLIGAAVGFGIVLLPPLAAFISSNHVEEAKTIVIVCWLIGTLSGALNGAFLGSLGNRYLERGRSSIA